MSGKYARTSSFSCGRKFTNDEIYFCAENCEKTKLKNAKLCVKRIFGDSKKTNKNKLIQCEKNTKIDRQFSSLKKQKNLVKNDMKIFKFKC